MAFSFLLKEPPAPLHKGNGIIRYQILTPIEIPASPLKVLVEPQINRARGIGNDLYKL